MTSESSIDPSFVPPRPAEDPRPAVTHMVVTPTKSVGIAILATIFFGPLGLFYASVRGALVVLALSFAAAVLLLTTGLAGHGSVGALVGLGSILPLAWIVSFVWGIVAVNSYNARLLQHGR